jgi:hypothetical protein
MPRDGQSLNQAKINKNLLYTLLQKKSFHNNNVLKIVRCLKARLLVWNMREVTSNSFLFFFLEETAAPYLEGLVLVQRIVPVCITVPQRRRSRDDAACHNDEIRSRISGLCQGDSQHIQAKPPARVWRRRKAGKVLANKGRGDVRNTEASRDILSPLRTKQRA